MDQFTILIYFHDVRIEVRGVLVMLSIGRNLEVHTPLFSLDLSSQFVGVSLPTILDLL